MGQLIRVVQNCAVNKMTVANVGIVFSPTLSVPPLVFTLMMSEYETIFPGGVIPDEEDEERRISVTSDIYTIGYRCIEFIEVKEGYKENAIFKLSGSATEIQKLRETFAKLGDVNLILPYNNYDIHNVAGLLKLWLKDLSPGLISTDMQSQFESLEGSFN